jgi:hypothetical protein
MSIIGPEKSGPIFLAFWPKEEYDWLQMQRLQMQPIDREDRLCPE